MAVEKGRRQPRHSAQVKTRLGVSAEEGSRYSLRPWESHAAIRATLDRATTSTRLPSPFHVFSFTHIPLYSLSILFFFLIFDF